MQLVLLTPDYISKVYSNVFQLRRSTLWHPHVFCSIFHLDNTNGSDTSFQIFQVKCFHSIDLYIIHLFELFVFPLDPRPSHALPRDFYWHVLWDCYHENVSCMAIDQVKSFIDVHQISYIFKRFIHVH